MDVSGAFCELSFFLCICIMMLITYCESKLVLVENFDLQINSKTGGIAVTDFDQDGIYEVIVAVFDGPNAILQFSPERNAYIDVGEERPYFLDVQDESGQTKAVCACDVDGDGSEEVFLLNQKSPLESQTDTHTNRLLKFENGTVTDLLDNPENKEMANSYSGGFVTCLDHDADGVYSLLMGSYKDDGSGVYKLFDLQNKHDGTEAVFRDISTDIGLDTQKDGTSCVIGPIINNRGYSDIFITNSNEFHVGSNFYRNNNSNIVFENQGNGFFQDKTELFHLQGDYHNYDSAAIIDLNRDDMVDLLVCSFYGPARKYVRDTLTNTFKIISLPIPMVRWRLCIMGWITNTDNTTSILMDKEDNFTRASGCRNLLVADFDNDGKIDVFKDDEKNDGRNVNAVFTVVPEVNCSGFRMEEIDIGDHLRSISVQGITVHDLNNDGILELIVAHKLYYGRTISIYQHTNISTNNWLRIIPLTRKGAPARATKVTLTLNDFSTITNIIGGGCSRACQSEPYAHFGLGNLTSFAVEVTWPDGHVIRKFLSDSDVRKTLHVSFTGHVVQLENILTQKQEISSADSKSFHILYLALCTLYTLLLS